MDSAMTRELDISGATGASYTVPGRCHNCNWRGSIRLKRGVPAPGRDLIDTPATCDHCGVRGVRADAN